MIDVAVVVAVVAVVAVAFAVAVVSRSPPVVGASVTQSEKNDFERLHVNTPRGQPALATLRETGGDREATATTATTAGIGGPS